MSPKSIDCLVIFDFSTPGSTSPESLHATRYEILRVKKPRGVVLRDYYFILRLAKLIFLLVS